MNNNTISSVKTKKKGGFINNNPFLIFFLPVILIIAVVAVFLIIKAVGNESETPVIGNGDYVYVLPIPERENAETTEGKLADPFANEVFAIALSGIIYNPAGTSTVILQTSTSSYVVTAGETIGDSGWSVKTIYSDSVTIEKDGVEQLLAISPEYSAK